MDLGYVKMVFNNRDDLFWVVSVACFDLPFTERQGLEAVSSVLERDR